MAETQPLIAELQKFDNPKGYRLTYEKVEKNLQPVVEQLITLGETCVDDLHTLLGHEETWSCWLALRALQHIKSEKSVLPLVNFIRRTDNSERWEIGEDAMKALTAIGKPTIHLLINELEKDFEKREFYTYIVGALTEIPDNEVLEFMLKTMKDYMNDYKKYDGWFDLVPFVLDFDKQDSRESLPLLEELYRMEHLSEEEKREIADTIEQLKDPEEYKRKMDAEMELMEKDFPKICEDAEKLFRPKKGDINPEEFFERASETDEDFEANVKCNDCGERQNLKTGLIWDVGSTFVFEHELMCTHCHSNDIGLTDAGKRELLGKQMRIYLGHDHGVIPVGKLTKVEDKEMPFKKAYKHILSRLSEEPSNAELCLRAANIASKNNKYKEAIQFYKKSMELDGSLIANYANLIGIYAYRDDYYGLHEYGPQARELFLKMVTLFNSHEYNDVTIRNSEELSLTISRFGGMLGFETHKRKIGRNEPCPCGSGKKYKRCCLGKNEG